MRTVQGDMELVDAVGLSAYQAQLMVQLWPKLYGTGAGRVGDSIFTDLVVKSPTAKDVFAKAAVPLPLLLLLPSPGPRLERLTCSGEGGLRDGGWDQHPEGAREVPHGLARRRHRRLQRPRSRLHRQRPGHRPQAPLPPVPPSLSPFSRLLK